MHIHKCSPDNLVPGRFGAFELVVKCGEMRLLRLSLLSSHQAARTESESAEGDWRSLTEGQWDTFWKIFQSGTQGEENAKLSNGVAKIQNWEVGDNAKLECDKHVTYFRSLVLLLERQSLVWVLILSCEGVQVNWSFFFIRLQKANHANILWDDMDKKLFSFFCINIFPFLKLCKNVQKKQGPSAYM